MARFRGAIYIDFTAPTKERALEQLRQVEAHLSDPEMEDLPEDYYNPYASKVAQIISGDLIGNAERLSEI